MAPQLWVHNAGAWHQCGPSTSVHVGGAWHALQQGWVRVSGVWQQFFQAFSGQTNTYNANGTYTETIPTGAVQVVIENWGASGSGQAGSGSGCAILGGDGAGSGGYNKVTLALTSADWGKTMAVVVGNGGAPSGFDGTASTISSGTKSITTLNGGGGKTGVGNGVAGGAGGTASGGTTNTAGNPGGVGAGSGGTGGLGIVGTNGTGNPGGHGGRQSGNAGQAGGDGLAIFKYT